jgi:hypothetical protein
MSVRAQATPAMPAPTTAMWRGAAERDERAGGLEFLGMSFCFLWRSVDRTFADGD